jgi:hypothetical protein
VGPASQVASCSSSRLVIGHASLTEKDMSSKSEGHRRAWRSILRWHIATGFLALVSYSLDLVLALITGGGIPDPPMGTGTRSTKVGTPRIHSQISASAEY